MACSAPCSTATKDAGAASPDGTTRFRMYAGVVLWDCARNVYLTGTSSTSIVDGNTIDVAFTGEQWRAGDANINDVLSCDAVANSAYSEIQGIPLGVFGILFTPAAMVVAQTILITPIIAALSRQIVAFVQELRRRDLFKLPGVAETLDWTRALTTLDTLELSPAIINDTLGTLLKYQDDIIKMQGTEAAKLLAEVNMRLAGG